MSGPFENPKFLLTVAGAAIVAIVVVVVVMRVTSGPSVVATGDDRGHGRCAVARAALDAFDQGRPPPAEWIQDRDAAARSVRECDQR